MSVDSDQVVLAKQLSLSRSPDAHHVWEKFRLGLLSKEGILRPAYGLTYPLLRLDHMLAVSEPSFSVQRFMGPRRLGYVLCADAATSKRDRATPTMTAYSTVLEALSDLNSGLRMSRVWLSLAYEDVGDQHRRTFLGPLWLLLNYLIYVSTFVVIFGTGAEIENFAAYAAIGMFVWLLLQEVVIQSVSLFTHEEAFIKGTRLPLSVYVFRLSAQTIIRAAYALIGLIFILLATGSQLSFGSLWSLIGLQLIIVTMPAVIVVFAVAGAYFPDLHFFISNLMRVFLFLSPVFWIQSGNRIRETLYAWNPFTHYIEIVRSPLLGSGFEANSFTICAALAALFWFAALWLLGRYRWDIKFVI